jgi:hypothetical protein
MKRNLILSGVLGLTLMFAGTEPGTAGTTGKIHGYVRDDRGAPLQGVNVLLDGLKQGAITDGGGYYAILNVTPDQRQLFFPVNDN